jgi:hypothetical protein
MRRRWCLVVIGGAGAAAYVAAVFDKTSKMAERWPWPRPRSSAIRAPAAYEAGVCQPASRTSFHCRTVHDVTSPAFMYGSAAANASAPLGPSPANTSSARS